MNFDEMKSNDNKIIARITGKYIEEEYKKPKKKMNEIFDMKKTKKKTKKEIINISYFYIDSVEISFEREYLHNHLVPIFSFLPM